MSGLSRSISSNSRPVQLTGRVQPTGKCGWSQVRETKDSLVSDLESIVAHAMRPTRVGGLKYSNSDPTLLALHESARALGLSNASNSLKKKKVASRRGLRGLTSHGRRTLMNACEYLSWRFQSKHCTFATLTIPTCTKAQAEAISLGWSKVVKNFLLTLGRKLHAKGLPPWIVSASEVQEKRFERSGIFALHLHCTFVGRHPRASWAITPKQIRGIWRRAILSVSPDLSDADFSSSENVQGVRKTVGGYLSKYLSKGVSCLDNVGSDIRRLFPSSWYSCTTKLRRIVSSCIRSGKSTGNTLASLPPAAFRYRRRIEVQSSDNMSRVVGWYGCLAPGWSAFFDAPSHLFSDEYLVQFPAYLIRDRDHDGFSHLLPSLTGRRPVAH